MNHPLPIKTSFARTLAVALLGGLLLISTATSHAVVLYSCPGVGSGGDANDRGFYMTNFPGGTMDSATLKLVGPAAGTYQVSLTVRSNAYNGPVLGTSTITVVLNAYPGAPTSATFPFATIPMPKGGTVCFSLAVVSGPSSYFFYDVGGGCPGVIETTDTAPPLSTFRTLGVDLTITGSSNYLTYSCGTGIANDWNYRGFYMTNFPGASLDSATLQLLGNVAGTYQVSLTVRQGTYDGPVLGTSTITVTLNGISGASVSATFPFANIPMPAGGTVCFIQDVVSGPYPNFFYNVASGCSGAIETTDTTPPLSGFRNLGVNLKLTGAPAVKLNIAQSGNTVKVFWQNVAGWSLEQTPSLYPPAGWSPSSGITTSTGTNFLNLISPPGKMLFRLKYP